MMNEANMNDIRNLLSLTQDFRYLMDGHKRDWKHSAYFRKK